MLNEKASIDIESQCKELFRNGIYLLLIVTLVQVFTVTKNEGFFFFLPLQSLQASLGQESVFHTLPTLTVMETNAGENSFCCHFRAKILKGIWDNTKHLLSPKLSISQGCASHRESVSQGQVITML